MVDIINYRGGKALLIDTYDIVVMGNDRLGEYAKALRQILQVSRLYVDYVLVISSFPWEKLPVFLRQAVSKVKLPLNLEGDVVLIPNYVPCYRANITDLAVPVGGCSKEYEKKMLQHLVDNLNVLHDAKRKSASDQALKEMSEMYDLVGADTDSVFVKEKEEEQK